MKGSVKIMKRLFHATMCDLSTLVIVMKVMAFVYGVTLGMTGVYFLAVSPEYSVTSETYQNMAELFPFEFYGVAFIVASVVLIVSLSSYPLTFFLVNAIGSGIGSACFMVYSAASYQPETEWFDQILAWRYGFVSICLMLMALVGVIVWFNGIIIQTKNRQQAQANNQTDI